MWQLMSNTPFELTFKQDKYDGMIICSFNRAPDDDDEGKVKLQLKKMGAVWDFEHRKKGCWLLSIKDTRALFEDKQTKVMLKGGCAAIAYITRDNSSVPLLEWLPHIAAFDPDDLDDDLDSLPTASQPSSSNDASPAKKQKRN